MAGEDPRYLRHIRGLPCAVCGANPPSDPHHLPRRHGGKRTHDREAIPACRVCHDDIQHPKSLKGRFSGRTYQWYYDWHGRLAGELYVKYRQDFAGPVVCEATVRRRKNGDVF
jgi:hypothetical protein